MMGFNMDMFSQLPEDESLYRSQYDLRAGTWPTSYNECVIVLTRSGFISDFLLYTIGFKDASELDEMMKAFSEGRTIDIEKHQSKVYNFEDFVGLEFKLVNPSYCYSYDSEYKVWTNKTDDKEYMKKVVRDSEPLTVVGVAVPSEDAKVAMLNVGINYTPELVKYVIEEASESEIVKSQLANRSIDVFSGKDFSDTGDDSAFDMESLFSIDEDALGNVFSFDVGAIPISPSIDLPDVDFTGLVDLRSILAGLPEFTRDDLKVFTDLFESVIDGDRLSKLANDLAGDFEKYTISNGIKGEDAVRAAIGEYLATESARTLIESGVSESIQSQKFSEEMGSAVQGIVGRYSDAFSDALEDIMNQAAGRYISQFENSINGTMGSLMSNIAGAFKFDQSAMERAFQIKMTEKELQELMTSLMSTGRSSYEGNLKKLGYADEEVPYMITIYPRDFESKANVVEILDSYNSRMKKSGDEDKVIRYTDIVGTLMSSVTDIINAISYVLIAFVAISLVVSSIMIGVITYISVLERKKEIGILRAIGASKRNISSVFNAETFIIGLLAGLIGVGISRLLLIPGNKLIHYLAENDSINAVLPWQAAVILVMLSVVLTLIGGIIPSRKAAKSDPVTALRTE